MRHDRQSISLHVNPSLGLYACVNGKWLGHAEYADGYAVIRVPLRQIDAGGVTAGDIQPDPPPQD